MALTKHGKAMWGLTRPFAAAVFASVMPAQAQTELEEGLAGALRGCQEWVLNPESRTNGYAPFVSAVGLGNKMGLVDQVVEAQLPPKQLRVANRYWRINSTNGAGFMLVVSDQLPMCHITGGGDTDMQPIIKSVLASTAFLNEWEFISDESTTAELTSSAFRSRRDPAFHIVISRASSPSQRLDRVQVFATAVYRPKNSQER